MEDLERKLEDMSNKIIDFEEEYKSKFIRIYANLEENSGNQRKEELEKLEYELRMKIEQLVHNK